MALLIDKYPYPKLERKTNEDTGVRQYCLPGGNPVPSVTTILSATADKTGLDQWRKRVGDAEADRISHEAASLGSCVHDSLEKYSLGKSDWEISGTNFFYKLARNMAQRIIVEGIANVNELWGLEVPVISPNLYAGTIDAVGLYKHIPTIIDFKTAIRMKKIEHIEDYFIQGCMYAMAHNEYFGTDIQQVAILMVDREFNYKEFVISGDKFIEYRDKALDRVATFHNM